MEDKSSAGQKVPTPAPAVVGRTLSDLLIELFRGRLRALLLAVVVLIAVLLWIVMLLFRPADQPFEFSIGSIFTYKSHGRASQTASEPVDGRAERPATATSNPPLPRTSGEAGLSAMSVEQSAAALSAVCLVSLKAEAGADSGLSTGSGQGAMGIAVGPSGGTYHQVMSDLLQVAGQQGQFRLVPTEGTAESMAHIRSPDINAGIGLLQADVFDAEQARHPSGPPLRKLMNLYREEVHLLAQRSVATLADLRGKHVSVGASGSGTRITASRILQASKLEVFAQAQSLEASLCDVVTGRLDAAFAVVGKPAPVFQRLSTFLAQYPAVAARLHFVPISRERAPLGHLEEAQLLPEDYPWLRAPVKTVATRAVLVAYDFSSGSVYHQQRCRQILALGQSLRAHGQVLQHAPAGRGSPHTKWRDVDFNSLRLPRIVEGRCVL